MAYIKTLCTLWENDVNKLSLLNQVKVLDKSLIYIDKRKMIFENLSTQLQACVDIFKDFNRQKHDYDIVDDLWPHIQFQKITSYVNML